MKKTNDTDYYVQKKIRERKKRKQIRVELQKKSAQGEGNYRHFLGSKVEHASFGIGEVVFANENKTSVQFEDYELKTFSTSTLCNYLKPNDSNAILFFDEMFRKCKSCGNYSTNLGSHGECAKCREKNSYDSYSDLVRLKCAICGKVLARQYSRDYGRPDEYCLCKSCASLIKDNDLNKRIQRMKSERNVDFCFISSKDLSVLYYKMFERIRSKNTTKLEKLDAQGIMETIESKYAKVAQSGASKCMVDIGATSTLYIHGGNQIGCKQQKHHVISATGIITIGEGRKENININLCLQCDRCFISNSEYQNMRDRFGIMYVKFEWINGNGNPLLGLDSNLSSMSPLSLTGYTVDAKTNFSAEERHEILANIIRIGILPKYRVIDYLNQFIRYNGAARNMANAVYKWRQDLDFVRNINIDTQPSIQIDSVKKW